MSDPWKHRSDNMKCKTCMWFVPKEAAEPRGYDLGRCRRHAPSMGGYPVVMVNDWCGDHRIDENKLVTDPAPMVIKPGSIINVDQMLKMSPGNPNGI